jgi:hypothetical protein
MQSLRSQYTPKVLPPVPRDTPIILVHDHTQKTVLTMLYVNGNNELNFESVYKSIKLLLRHPLCSHRQSEDHWPCTPCAQAFSTTFWGGACRLLDYFADFLIHDNGVMSGLWFYLLDIWQEMHVWFPCDAVLARGTAGSGSEVALAAARSFKSDFEATVELVDRVIHGTEQRKVHREQLIHTPSGETRGPAGAYNTGPWVSGLTPWEQFLLKGSPGVAGFKKDEKDSVRYIPMAAISIIKAHTERARRLAAQMNPDPEFLNHFDKNKLWFPQSTDAPSHLYKLPDNTTTTYGLVNGAPPIIQSPGFNDPNQTCSKQTLLLLDEFVGRCKGVRAYKPVSGDEDANGDEGMRAFDMWAVSQRKGSGGSGKDSIVTKGWDEKFQELCKRSRP